MLVISKINQLKLQAHYETTLTHPALQRGTNIELETTPITHPTINQTCLSCSHYYRDDVYYDSCIKYEGVATIKNSFNRSGAIKGKCEKCMAKTLFLGF